MTKDKSHASHTFPFVKTSVMQSGTNLFAIAKRFVESKHPYATDELSYERRVPSEKPSAADYRNL
jgi:hypothetical protein